MPKQNTPIVPRRRFVQARPSTNGRHKRPKGDGAREVEDVVNLAPADDGAAMLARYGAEFERACEVAAARPVQLEAGAAGSPRPLKLPSRAELLKVARRAFKEMAGKPAQKSEGPLPDCPALESWLSGADRVGFPTHVLPPLLRRYVAACARSIFCPPDLIAVPMLTVAGAAIGRSGRRLKVKDGWSNASSCLWSACLTPSSGGKTPALNAVQNFYSDRQAEEYRAYQEAKTAHEEDPEANPKPGPYPALRLTDTTIESLCVDLAAGPVLYIRDELGAWCHQMGQYKQGNSDRHDWCSFWSHSGVDIGRKAGRVHIESPFVSVTGMMVPASARELNYRGSSEDGFVHRMLLAYPKALPPVATLEGVPDHLTADYKRRMTLLFDPPEEGEAVLTFEPKALDMLLGWANTELYASLDGYVCTNPGQPPEEREYRREQTAPDWLVSKYRKLYDNCIRLCLVLHELWRVAGDDTGDGADEWDHPRNFYGQRIAFRPGVVDRLTVERAIAVVDYFRGHIDPVQALLGEETAHGDDADRLYHRFRERGSVKAREVVHGSGHKSTDAVLAVFDEWQRRGYGTVEKASKGGKQFKFNAE